MPGLGRIYSKDERDEEYPLRAAIPQIIERVPYRYHWANGWWGNQGSTSECVAYAWLHWLADGPNTFRRQSHPMYRTRDLYCRAQTKDPWPGDCNTRPHYDGTSVRAAAKALQNDGHIIEYRWARSLFDVLDTLETRGPLIAGTLWTSGMDSPDEDGLVRIDGRDRGGHAYVVNGFNRVRQLLRCKNSWGRRWGRNGFFWIRFQDFEQLLADRGEACFAIPAQM
jgi:hypothetical protein